LLEGDLPKAGSLIVRLVADLEAYVALNANAVKPPAASTATPEPTAEPQPAQEPS
jgi:hypothetical protein